jgi:hypothetical protein
MGIFGLGVLILFVGNERPKNEGITFGYSFICVHFLWFFYFTTDDADFHRWDSLAWEF